jgi:hypothetical protein
MHPRLRERGFWTWLYERAADDDAPGPFRVRLALGAEHVVADVDESYGVTLLDGATGAELGWIDDAHWHPNCLRVGEVLALAGGQATAADRAAATLLLVPFAVITTHEDEERLGAAAEGAWRQLGFEGACSGLEWADFLLQDVEWYQAHERWWLRQPQDLHLKALYTVRVAENVRFPGWLSRL